MSQIEQETIDWIKAAFPSGTRLRLLEMDDPQPKAAGSEGTVQKVDDNGMVIVKWDDGTTDTLFPDRDSFIPEY